MKREHDHVAKRRGFEEQHVKSGRIRARGSMTYARFYSDMEERLAMREERKLIDQLQGKVRRYWQVERRAGPYWVTADRSMQGDTFEQALKMCQGLPGYRVVRVWGSRAGH